MKPIFIVIILLFGFQQLHAENIPVVKITEIAIKESESSVKVTFNALVPKIGSNYKLTLTPVLYNGVQSKSLTPIVVTGNKKTISDRRVKQSEQTPKNALRVKQGEQTPYSITIPYESWMNTVSLRVNSSIQSCCNQSDLSAMNLVADKMIHYDIKPSYNNTKIAPQLSKLQQLDEVSPFLYPEREYALRYETFEKQRENGALIIYFKQSKSTIDPTYRTNRETLAQVREVLATIEADTNATLKKIVIVGLSSPEGTITKNTLLSEKRANSLKNFVREVADYHSDQFELLNGAEDWEGLRTLVEASQMPYRDLVLETMDKYPVDKGRNYALMDLKGGRPYFYMMEHFFPDLRNAGYIQIYYDYKPDTDVDYINSAMALIKEQKYSEALTTLAKVRDQRRIHNATGVCHMMSGDYSKAKKYFDKAIATGDKDAVENMNRIKLAQSIEK